MHLIFCPKDTSSYPSDKYVLGRRLTLIPQLKETYSYHLPSIIEGFKLILWGAFKKLVIADRITMLIDGVYSNLLYHTLYDSGSRLLTLNFLLSRQVFYTLQFLRASFPIDYSIINKLRKFFCTNF